MNLQRRRNCRHENVEIDIFNTQKIKPQKRHKMLTQQKARKMNLNFKYDSIAFYDNNKEHDICHKNNMYVNNKIDL